MTLHAAVWAIQVLKQSPTSDERAVAAAREILRVFPERDADDYAAAEAGTKSLEYLLHEAVAEAVAAEASEVDDEEVDEALEIEVTKETILT